MTTAAAEMMQTAVNPCQKQNIGVPGGTMNRGIITNIKAADLPEEPLGEFSNIPLEFENTARILWDDTQKIYVHACTANRFSENYLMFCGQLEKNIKQLGSYCLTKAVLEQNGIAFPELSKLSIKELAGMVSFHLRKAHAALEGIYRDNNVLGMTYLNWEFRWAGLNNRLKATEVKIQKIREGKINTDSMLEQAQPFKDESRSGEKAAAETPQSLRANPNALPIKGSMARLMLSREKEAEKKAEQERKDYLRKVREAERLEREADRILGPMAPAKPYEPNKEVMAMIKRMDAEALRSEISAEEKTNPIPPLQTKTKPELSQEDKDNEAEARKMLMEDAMRRKDQTAIMAIPLEDSDALYERWLEYFERLRQEVLLNPLMGPSADVRKSLREKRKKKKR